MSKFLHILALLAVAAQPASTLAQLDSSNTWVSTAISGGPHTVHTVILDPLQPDTVFAGTTPGSIYRSLNRTLTWAEITSAGTVINQDVHGIAFNPLNTNVMYAGSLNKGAYKSIDHGVTWAVTSLGGPFLTRHLAVDPTDTNRVYAATGLTVFYSDNGGTTWTDAKIDTVSGVNAEGFVMMPLTPDTLLVGVPTRGVFRSLNRGVLWLVPNVGLTDLDVTALAASPEFAGTAYVTTTGGGVFVTADAGSTWTAQNSGITNLNLRSIAVSPSNPTVLYTGSDNGDVFKSPDRGMTWLNITGDLGTAVAVNDLFVHPDSANVVYAALDNVYRIKQTGLDSISFFPTGATPFLLTVADLNVDSVSDIVAANVGAQSVQVMLNGSLGANFTSTSYSTGAEPTVLGTADLEGDGDVDVIVGNRLQQTIAILFNDSTGAYPTSAEIFVGLAVTELVLADLDNDLDTDIAVTDDATGTISVYLNDGLGSFSAPKLITGPAAPSAMIAGDFTENGITDLLVASSKGNTVSLLRNLGNATFQIGTPISLTGTPGRMKSGDFDIDGDLDFAVSLADRTVRIWKNQGTGTFGDSASVATADTVNSMFAVDMDEDGYLDLVTPLGNGDITVLINDANGVFTDSVVIDNQPGIGVAVAGDLNGDSLVDLALARPSDNGLLFYSMPIPQNIKKPASPRDLVAADSQSDLGGRNTLTWRRPNVDETTGRLIRYRVMRATSLAGPYTLLASLDTTATHVRDSVFVNRTYIDTTATVGTNHYYYLLSENAEAAQSVPSDTVNATSAPQPFFDFAFNKNSPLHINDTIEVTARLTAINHKPKGLSLFVNYDTRALRLLDANAVDTGIQPFTIDTTLATESTVLQNRVDTLSTAGTGKIDLTFGFLPDVGTQATALGTIRFGTLRDTTTRVRIVNDTTTVRQTALTDSTGALILPFISPATSLVIRNHRVRGELKFQGRTENLDMLARIDLTMNDFTNSGVPLADSIAYRPPNDLDLTTSGVQLKLTANGSFVLQQVRGGNYGLFAKTFHYLRSRIAVDSLVVNDSTGVSGTVNFRWVGIDTSFKSTPLRAGDANDDNQVDLADFGLLGSTFGSSGFSEGSQGWSADFNGDGVVNLADFGLLQSNFGEVGWGPSVVAKPVGPRGEIVVAEGDPSGTQVISVRDAGDIKGFTVDLFAPGMDTSAVAVDGLSFFDAGEVLHLSRRIQAGDLTIHRVAAVLTDGSGFEGSGSLFSIALGEGRAEEVRLGRVQFLDPSGLTFPGIGAPVRLADSGFPIETAILQNMPNPFNPATLIPYQLGDVGRVTIKVYSTLGQELRILVDEVHEVGRYGVIWDGRDQVGREVASGVYLYRFQADHFVEVRKALLLR